MVLDEDQLGFISLQKQRQQTQKKTRFSVGHKKYMRQIYVEKMSLYASWKDSTACLETLLQRPNAAPDREEEGLCGTSGHKPPPASSWNIKKGLICI